MRTPLIITIAIVFGFLAMLALHGCAPTRSGNTIGDFIDRDTALKLIAEWQGVADIGEIDPRTAFRLKAACVLLGPAVLPVGGTALCVKLVDGFEARDA